MVASSTIRAALTILLIPGLATASEIDSFDLAAEIICRNPRATSIVEGIVGEQWTEYFPDGMPYTVSAVHVVNRIRGRYEVGGELLVATPGGQLPDGSFEYYSGRPTIHSDDVVLLATRPHSIGYERVNSASKGFLRLKFEAPQGGPSQEDLVDLDDGIPMHTSEPARVLGRFRWSELVKQLQLAEVSSAEQCPNVFDNEVDLRSNVQVTP